MLLSEVTEDEKELIMSRRENRCCKVDPKPNGSNGHLFRLSTTTEYDKRPGYASRRTETGYEEIKLYRCIHCSYPTAFTVKEGRQVPWLNYSELKSGTVINE